MMLCHGNSQPVVTFHDIVYFTMILLMTEMKIFISIDCKRQWDLQIVVEGTGVLSN